MATVIFYEKPGCHSNAKQKRMLAAAGLEVLAKNLLTEAWEADTLRAFFGALPVRDWFNYSAPAIKNREIDPEALSAEAALAFMLAQPLLIRRPLMQFGDLKMAGFDPQQVAACFGLPDLAIPDGMQNCSKAADKPACHHDDPHDSPHV